MFEAAADSSHRDRGQSEIIGYVLVFAIIVTALGTASVVGVTALQDVRSHAVTNSGELAMRAVSEDLDALATGTARSRVSELTLRSGTLATGAETSIRVEWKRASAAPSDPWQPEPDLPADEVTYRPIVFGTGQANVAYTGSLLVRDQTEGAVTLNGPLFSVSPDSTVLPIVLTKPTAMTSVGGGTHQVVARREGAEAMRVSGPTTVRISIETVPGRVDVWKRALETEIHGSNPCDPPAVSGSAATLTCTFDTDRLVVSRTHVSYRFR